jgi:hypothetical protein
MKRMRQAIIVVAAGLVLNSAWALDHAYPLGTFVENRSCDKPRGGELLSKTELYFGLSRPNGLDVTEEEFQRFVDTEITPRFPDGLTLLTGRGQYRNSAGNIVQEWSKILILLYPFNQKRNRAIEQIRGAYKDAYQQESVLRVDETSCVSF